MKFVNIRIVLYSDWYWFATWRETIIRVHYSHIEKDKNSKVLAKTIIYLDKNGGGKIG